MISISSQGRKKAAKKLKHRYRRKYGLDFHEAIVAQGNKCAICHKEFDGSNAKTPTLDHDHSTGKIRGILCRGCNWQLGLWEKRKEEFEAYLARKGRPTRDAFFQEIAKVVAKRGTCPRKRVGCILTVENRIVALGYNGAPKGLPHCDRVGCNLDELGGCTNSAHAELNAISFAARKGLSKLEGATCYTTCSPCLRCSQLLITAGIERVVFLEEYRDRSGVELLLTAGVTVG